MEDVEAGREFSQYRLRFTIDHDDDGYYDQLIFNNNRIIITYTDSSLSKQYDHFDLPVAFSLEQNYPNPFNNRTTIAYDLKTESNIIIKIYTLNGHEIKTPTSGLAGRGRSSVEWDGTDYHGNPLGSGIYIYKLTAENDLGDRIYQSNRKMIFLK